MMSTKHNHTIVSTSKTNEIKSLDGRYMGSSAEPGFKNKRAYIVIKQ